MRLCSTRTRCLLLGAVYQLLQLLVTDAGGEFTTEWSALTTKEQAVPEDVGDDHALGNANGIPRGKKYMPMQVINGDDGTPVALQWPANASAIGKVRLTLGYMATWSVAPVEGPAIEQATRRFLEEDERRSKRFDIRMVWRSGGGSPVTGVPSIIRLYEDLGADVILGPLVSTVCIPAGYSVSFWNLPFFPNGCSDPFLTDKTIYKTMIRSMPSYHKTGGAFVAIFQHYNWTRAYLISALGLCDMGARGVESAFRDHNITLAEWIRTAADTGDITDADIDEYLQRAKARSRIIIMCQTKAVRMRIMYRAFELGMTNGDFVFFYYWLLPDGTTRQLWDDYEPSWEKGPLPVYTPEQRETLKKALYFLKLVTIANTLGPHVDAIMQGQVDITKEPHWNFTQDQLRLVSAAREYTLLMYDATYLYLLTVDKALAANKDHRNGTLLFSLAKGTTFQGATGKVVTDSNGDRDPEYWLWDYGPGMHQYEHVAKISIVGLNMDKKLVITNEPYWGTADGKAPPSTPRCGFRGELCPADNQDTVTTVVVVVVVVLLVSFCLATLVYLRRKKKLNEEIQQMIWKIDYNDIQFIKNGGVNVSCFSIETASAASLRTGGSLDGFSTGEKQLYTKRGLCRGSQVAVNTLHLQAVILTRQDLLELKELKVMGHDNLNPFIGACVDPPNVCTVEVYCSKGSLQDILENEDVRLDWTFKMAFVNDIINGMAYLQESIFQSHGKLTSGNCLVDSRWTVKLTSFGLNAFQKTVKNGGQYEDYRKLLWTAPELLRADELPRYGSALGDVYSFGIVLQEIIFRDMPFFNALEPKDIVAMVKAGGDPYYRPAVDAAWAQTEGEQGASKKGVASHREVLSLMKRCWAEKPLDRPTFNDIKKSLKSINRGRKHDIVDNMIIMLERYAGNLEELVRDRTAQLVEEKKKTDLLLYQMLPPSVAEKLKTGTFIEPEIFDRVTIYFSDIVGFTSISSESTPMQVVDLLNDLYTMFDDTISKHDVYKVETVGDAYMVVSGLPKRNGDSHVVEICNMTLDLIVGVKKFKIRHRPEDHLKIRVGLHTGSCAAGVVGLKMPRYCLFGDTVNMASRMESTGEALRIHISQDTYYALTNYPEYRTELRGQTYVKGKGEVNTYWLCGKDGYKVAYDSLFPGGL